MVRANPDGNFLQVVIRKETMSGNRFSPDELKAGTSRKRSRRRLSAVLIGVGGYGRSHRRLIRQLEEQGLLQLTDVIDPGPENLPEIFTSLQEQHVRWHRSWEEFLTLQIAPDCVFIAAPIHLHAEYARKVLPTGASIYLEKPPVPLLGQIDELIALECGHPRIQVGFSFSYSKQMQALRQWIEDGRLGEIECYRLTACWPRADKYYQRSNWAGRLWLREDAVMDGPATNALSHRIHDLLTIEAFARGGVCVPDKLSSELYQARSMETYDICSAKGAFPSGAEFGITLSHACAIKNEGVLEVRGSGGWARLQGPDLALSASFTPEIIVSEEEPVVNAFRQFVECVHTGKPPLVGLNETRPYVATTNAMLLSSGRIHPIDCEHYQEVKSSNGNIFDVREINCLSEQAFQSGLNFSELDAPWGVPGKDISLANLSSSEIEAHLKSLGKI